MPETNTQDSELYYNGDDDDHHYKDSITTAKRSATTAFITKENHDNDVYQGLILKIHQLQELLQKSQESLILLSLEKSTAYHENEKLASLLKQHSYAIDKNKEEIWNLELAKQDLSQQLHDLQLRFKKLMMEQSRWSQQEVALKQELEYYRQQQIEWKSSMDNARKDKLELFMTKKKLNALQSSLSKIQYSNNNNSSNARTILSPSYPSSINNIYSDSHYDDITITPLTPIKNKNKDDNNQEDPYMIMATTLQSNLGNYQKMVHQLKQALEDEKKKKLEMELLWREAQEIIENNNNNNNNACIISTASSSTSSLSHENKEHTNSLIDSSQQLFLSDELSIVNHRHGSEHQQQRYKPIMDHGSPTISIQKIAESSSTSLQENINENNGLLIKEKCATITKEEEGEKESILNRQQSPRSISLSSLPPSPPVEFITFEQQEENDILSDDDDDASYQKSINSIIKELKNEDMYGSVLTTESYIYSSQKLITNKETQQLPSQQHQQQQQLLKIMTNKNIHHNHHITTTLTPSSFTHFSSSYYHHRMKALSHTMIGDWLWKYTNYNANKNNNKNKESSDGCSKKFYEKGKGHKKHERYFWLHPYSKILYWSIEKPGNDMNPYNTKSVLIESFHIIDEKKYIIELQTSHRSLKIQYQHETSYQAWVTSFHYLFGHHHHQESYVSSSLIQHQNHLSRLFMHFPPSASSATFIDNNNNLSTTNLPPSNNNDNNNNRNDGFNSNVTLSSSRTNILLKKNKKSTLFIPSLYLSKLKKKIKKKRIE
ncbi:meiotic cell cortex C-terminal pleckstrin homology-domain-containing protein [Cunninghamella echinulata]|nr:meiotic cell cortex C-terminal pleckstrin homology-domain-containing protein [Cunninghamella echinulata]